MKTLSKAIVACTLFVVPGTAFGQSADVKYCAALADKYNDFIGQDDLGKGRTSNPVIVDVAIEKCKSGDTSGIPMLEQALKNAKVNLPPRT